MSGVLKLSFSPGVQGPVFWGRLHWGGLRSCAQEVSCLTSVLYVMSTLYASSNCYLLPPLGHTIVGRSGGGVHTSYFMTGLTRRRPLKVCIRLGAHKAGFAFNALLISSCPPCLHKTGSQKTPPPPPPHTHTHTHKHTPSTNSAPPTQKPTWRTVPSPHPSNGWSRSRTSSSTTTSHTSATPTFSS